MPRLCLRYAYVMPPLWLSFWNREIAEDWIRQIDRRTKYEVGNSYACPM